MDKCMSLPALRFKNDKGQDFPEWGVAELKQLAEINPKSSRLPDEFIYIDLESVEKGLLLKEDWINLEDAPSRAQRYLSQNDILFQMVRPYQRNNLFFDKVGYYVASTGYAQIRAYQTPKFLYYCLHLDEFVAEVMNRCTGTSYPAINSDSLSAIELRYPTSKDEQTKIANFLTAVDEKITQLTQKCQLLAQYKKGVMQQIFRQELRFKDENGQDFPEWRLEKLSDVIELHHGYQFRTTDFTSKGLAVIKIGDVINNNLNLDNLSFIDSSRLNEFSKFQVKEGDILMSLTGNIGRVVEVGKLPFVVLQNYRVGKFVPHDDKVLSNKFIKHLLASDDVFGRFGQLSNQSAQANFGKQDMDKIIVKVPSMFEQTLIANFLSALDDKLTHTQNQLAAAKQYKQGLLQQMFV